MDAARLAYLSRYIFILIIGFVTFHLARFALKQVRARIKLRSAAMPGFFLFLFPTPSPAHGLASWSQLNLMPKDWPTQGQLRSQAGKTAIALPLYSTTVIGRSAACDLVFSIPHMERRAVIVYRFDGNWYVRPTGHTNVTLNGDSLTGPHILVSRDKIGFNGLELTFVDEREETIRAGFTYDESLADRQSGNFQALQKVATTAEEITGLADILGDKGPWLPWLGMNFFILLSYMVMYMLFPTNDLSIVKAVAAYEIIIAVLLNGYFLLLPLTSANFDRCSFLTMAQLILLGNVVQFRLALINRSQIVAAKLAGDHRVFAELIDYVVKEYRTQVTALILGLVLLPIIYILVSHTRILESVMPFCLAITPLLYLATLILGRDTGGHGAGLWLSLGGVSLQLSEFAKITYLIVLAGFFKIRPRLRQQLFFAAWAGLNFFLIMMLPDLGSVMMLLPTTLVVYIIMTSEYWRAGVLLLGGSAMSVIAYQLFPYVRKRLYGWQSLWTEINPGNEQIVFGLQAVARGGLWGRGIGNGSPAGIPEASGDMVFSVLCEEWGLLVGLFVVVLFLVIWLRSILVAADSEDGFTGSMVLGIATLLFFEAMIVIGGSTGLIPLTGATLPFIAKGGSSVLAKLIMSAIFLGLAGRRNRYNGA